MPLVAALEDHVEGVDDAGDDEENAEKKVDEELHAEAVHEEHAGGGEEEAEGSWQPRRMRWKVFKRLLTTFEHFHQLLQEQTAANDEIGASRTRDRLQQKKEWEAAQNAVARKTYLRPMGLAAECT